MKWIAAALSSVLLSISLISDDRPISDSLPKPQDVTLIISGNVFGHLSPCGCTSPMSGGMKRLGTLVRQYKSLSKTLWLDTGNITASGSRQEQLKLETYSEMLGKLGIDVVAFSGNDAVAGIRALGPGRALSGAQWIGDSTGLPSGMVQSSVKLGPLTFTTLPGTSTIKIGHKGGTLEVIQTEGAAQVLSKKLTPGSHLRGVVVAKFRNGILVDAKAIPLESKIADDPQATQIYRAYLRRLDQSGVINLMPRTNNSEYVGSEKCASCHPASMKVHSASAHAKAFKTLVTEGHSNDPDCVSCHVVGVESSRGFQPNRTPEFQEVGCESCHGSGASHSIDPKAFRLGKVGGQKCQSCHTPNTSPGFTFDGKWSKIKH
jgi:hypothetical protein